MPIQPFRRVQSSNADLNAVQSNIANTLNELLRNPLLNGHLLAQTTLRAGSNLVSHGLGRNYVSWCVLNPSAFVAWAYGKSPDATKYINVNVSAPCTVDIYVF